MGRGNRFWLHSIPVHCPYQRDFVKVKGEPLLILFGQICSCIHYLHVLALLPLWHIHVCTLIYYPLYSDLSLLHTAHPPLQLVQNCAEHYLTSEHKSIRMEAVRTCAALLVPNLLPPTIFTNPYVTFSAASAQVVGDVLGKLLTVGITDPGEWYMYMWLITWLCLTTCCLSWRD